MQAEREREEVEADSERTTAEMKDDERRWQRRQGQYEEDVDWGEWGMLYSVCSGLSQDKDAELSAGPYGAQDGA